MKTNFKILITAIFLFTTNNIFALMQEEAFAPGEKLTYKLYYKSIMTGSVTAGVMTSETISNSNDDSFILRLKGKTKGAFRWFFAADDEYESHVNSNMLPFYFKKRISEGSYTSSKDFSFNQEAGVISATNNKSNKVTNYTTDKEVQDILSSLYKIRNWDFDNIKMNEIYSINIFMDDSVYQIEFKYVGDKTIDTELGEIACMMFKPKVISGGVFGEGDENPMTVYVSKDKNHLPIMAESKLAIGKARMELIKHEGLQHNFVIASK